MKIMTERQRYKIRKIGKAHNQEHDCEKTCVKVPETRNTVYDVLFISPV